MNKWDEQDKVRLSADAIYIGDEPRIILCASAFYFRIPREEWRDRLNKVAASGYNCIDVYFPWNYHEMQEGHWDFTGGKDVDSYLALAAELGLWVIARPGPFICSEWDMGGLPAYLLTKPGLVLRDYNELYLSYVKKWYNKIMPILSKYQIGNQGTVIAVQVENELDFYDCGQVNPYISALRDFSLEAGIQVPIIACAGQCDIERSGGFADGVTPAVNLYPGDREKSFEDKVNHYVEAFRTLDIPLCITETNRSHFILRRELIAGAKMMSAYNQVGGTDFGFTTSVNNWGKPMTYLTHDYDFAGMINAQGEYLPEYNEALLLGGIIKSFEKGIGQGKSVTDTNLCIQGDCMLSNSIKRTLQLPGGGRLAAVANIDQKPGKITFIHNGKSRPSYTVWEVEPLTCPIIPVDISLNEPGTGNGNIKLEYSTAQLCHVHICEDTMYLLMYTDGEAETALSLIDEADIQCSHMDYHREQNLHIFTFTKVQTAAAVISFENGKKLYLYGVSGEVAVRCLKNKIYPWDKKYPQNKLNLQDEETQSCSLACPSEEIAEKICGGEEALIYTLQNMPFSRYLLSGMGDEIGNSDQLKCRNIMNMEDMKFFRGYGWYEGSIEISSKESVKGYMIYNGMDLLHLYRNDEYIGTAVGDGTHQFMKEEKNLTKAVIKLGLRCEIWGHSNFSDSRLPAMNIKCKKGITGLAVITDIKDITDSWCYCKNGKADAEVTLLNEKDSFRPVIAFGSYNNPEQPQAGIYKRKVKLSPGCMAAVLMFEGFRSSGKVYADGRFVKSIQPYDSSVTLNHAENAVEMEIAIDLEQKTIQESQDVKLCLYEGRPLSSVTCCGADENKIAAFADKLDNGITIPLKDIEFKPGEVAVLSSTFVAGGTIKSGLKLRIAGRDVKVLVLLNGVMTGRLWLPSTVVRPDFSGGDATLLYLPASFMKEENRLDILVEALQGEPHIEKLLFKQVKEKYEDWALE